MITGKRWRCAISFDLCPALAMRHSYQIVFFDFAIESSAMRSIVGRVLPRAPARRSIPALAVALK